MSYSTYPPIYSTYQPTTTSSYVPYQSVHYPSLYPSYQPFQPPALPKSSPPPPDLPPPPPDLSSVSSKVASSAMARLLAIALRDAGFDAAQHNAMQRLEAEVVAFVERLYKRAHDYANLANRSGPIVKDLVLACQDSDVNLQSKDLQSLVVNHSKRRRRKGASKFVGPSTLVPPPSRPASPDLLPSDDEGAQPIVPSTLRGLPPYMPSLPPKHTYLRTPPSPPKRAALPSLEKKLKTASLVQNSLKNLLLATEDTEGHEDGELLGHIVNWEAGLHPRKRWRIGQQ